MKNVSLLLTMLVVAVMCHFDISAQELNCKVEINSDKVQNVSKEVFKTLESAIADYVNTNKWGNAQFMANEKIECRLFFTIASYDNNIMTGDLQVQSSRPVYNSNYTTTSNLTAILNFYCYLILALDFDSFSPSGGDFYYEKAAAVVQMAQSSGEKGWKAFEDTKNRSAVLSAYTDKTTSALRDILYQYHRKGLDEMALSVDKGRATVTQCIELLKGVYDVAPMSVGLSIFKDSKLDELVNIYSKAGSVEKEKVYELLYPLYPTENDRLQKIKTVSKTN